MSREEGREEWPLMERYRASSNYSLCSQAFAALHSLLVSRFLFYSLSWTHPLAIPSSCLLVWLCVFFFPPSSVRVRFLLSPYSSPFCSRLFVFLPSWFSRMVCSFSLFPYLSSFRLRFTVFHCRNHLFGWYSPLSGSYRSAWRLA